MSEEQRIIQLSYTDINKVTVINLEKDIRVFFSGGSKQAFQLRTIAAQRRMKIRDIVSLAVEEYFITEVLGNVVAS